MNPSQHAYILKDLIYKLNAQLSRAWRVSAPTKHLSLAEVCLLHRQTDTRRPKEFTFLLNQCPQIEDITSDFLVSFKWYDTASIPTRRPDEMRGSNDLSCQPEMNGQADDACRCLTWDLTGFTGVVMEGELVTERGETENKQMKQKALTVLSHTHKHTWSNEGYHIRHLGLEKCLWKA